MEDDAFCSADWSVSHSRAEDLMATMPDNSVDLVLVDPPYYKVKDEPWDHQWDNPAAFIAWIGALCNEWKRVLKPNGSLYVCASPEMSARVEVKVAEAFNVLRRITWRKPPFSTKAEMFDKETMRTLFPASECIIFAEKYGADRISPFATIMADCMERLDLTQRDVSRLEVSRNGNPTGWVHNKLSGRQIPTRSQWGKMCALFGMGDEYDSLLAEFEEMRRPFSVTANVPYTDVWDFQTVQAYPGKHVCEKPQPLLEHIIRSSSREGAVVFDCFAGSGATGVAALNLGRRFIGCDASEHWADYARKRLAQQQSRPAIEQAVLF